MSAPSRHPAVLAVIIFAQFAGTSLWFAGNAILPDLQSAWQLPADVLGPLTSAVQAGFISGTFCFAVLALADRLPAPMLFFACAVCGATANLILLLDGTLLLLLSSRFLTGFFLAGIYPVGMKIAAHLFPDAVGRAIGWLVGALVLGTAFPHVIRVLGTALPWQFVVWFISALALLGGAILLLTLNQQWRNTAPLNFKPGVVLKAFGKREFRLSAAGYFGHMWELYAFWAFVPLFIAARFNRSLDDVWTSWWTFLIIAIGSVGCVVAGQASQRFGSGKPALLAIGVSGLCCLLSPLIFLLPTVPFMLCMLLWGIAVIADSAQFSTLTAKFAPQGYVGSALTMVTCIGFTISIFSIETINYLSDTLNAGYMLLPLTPGPLLGWWVARGLWRS